MSASESESNHPSSTRPYLIRALYEWCADNGFTPYIAVQADETVQVPREYVRGGEIVLNVSAGATSALMLDNDCIRFKARFGGVAREIIVPVDHVMAIFARETGQGMAFAAPAMQQEEGGAANTDACTPESLEGKPVPDSYLNLPSQTPDGKVLPAAAGSARGGIQLVSSTPTPNGSDNEPPPPTSPRPRPVLKRVK